MPFFGDTPKFPEPPAPRTPPPTPTPLPPPARTSEAVQGAEEETRALARRRGRRQTLLTPGGGAGDTGPVVSTRKTLLGE
jgi:hypothetical protein